MAALLARPLGALALSSLLAWRLGTRTLLVTSVRQSHLSALARLLMEKGMFRPITIAAVLSLGIVGPTNAATYCAKYVGGQERVGSGARSQCEFSTLQECRASVRERGGGRCYKMAHPTEPGRLR